MKRIKRVFAVLLTLAMALGMSVTSFATTAGSAGDDGIFGTSDDRGVLSIGGITMEENLTVTAYPIIKAQYGDNGNGTFSGYDIVYRRVNPVIELIPGEEPVIKEEHLAAIMGSLNGAEAYSMTLADGKATASVPVGSYLVVISGADTKTYSPIVASAYYVNKDGQNAIEGKEITDIAVSQNWVKVTDTPTLDKSIQGSNGTPDSNSVNIGDEVNYEVLVKPIPYYGGEYPQFVLTDTLDKGLTYKTDSYIVEYGVITKDEDGKEGFKEEGYLTSPAHFTVVETPSNNGGGSLKLDFVVNGKYTLNEYQGKAIRLTYTATLNQNATFNQIPNTNKVELDFSNDSRVDENCGHLEDETYTYTFDIDAEGTITNKIITKVGESSLSPEDPSAPLAGAQFKLYTDKDCKTEYTNSAFNNEELISDKDGQLKIQGLKADASAGGSTYYLKETKAPDGYSLNTNVYEIKIVPTYMSDGKKIESWTITVSMIDASGTTTELGKNIFKVDYENKNNTENIKVELNDKIVFDGEIIEGEQGGAVDETQINNTKLSSLPSTGGIGTTIFTIGGCLIMIIAAGLFFATRRKSTK
jgi:fimbrial isopeptide formation D2 family protein/LPXTG-motif cell wall-anchored protein